MNRSPVSAPSSRIAPGPVVLAVLILVAALTRLLPHPPNFSPVAAIALFAGAHFVQRRWAFLAPLAALVVSDLALAAMMGGLYASWFGGIGIWVVYGCIALTSALGLGLRGRVTGARVLGYGLAGSTLFFLVTNFGAWLGNPMYPQSAQGLLASYAAGVPFFKWSILGTLVYSAALFGGFALLRDRLPALRLQTA